VRADLGLSAAAAGLLTTGPLLCLGILAPLGPRIARRMPVERLLVIYGNNTDTTAIQVKVGSPQGKPPNWYDFDHKQKGPGDDVVPVVSARLPGVAAVEIRSEDVSYFHPIQHGLAALDLHAFLPALDEVATIVGRFLDGKQETELLPAGLPRARFRR